MEEDNNSSNDSTDAYSEKFDALKALTRPNVRIPVPDAPIYDNLSKFESVALKGLVISSKPKNDASKASKQQLPARRFLPSQMPIQSTSRDNNQSGKNVLNRMGKAQGPLFALYQYMENRIRVKITTRNDRGVRGYVEAYIAAFDKHWNLALEDCFEHWTRKVKRKAPALGDPSVNPLLVPSTSSVNSSTKVISRTKKFETLERHVPQLLLRGEHVVMVNKVIS
ncbi:unnamed protein product [Trichogramma brassicae]|uniref:Sm domain-containing protein n=1 Tax=Trichogramma brassicae TaxID=86971 RepID=A0A6H5J0S7_9HYME|nr:unnamed protein product [Trichogramma brassicae]